MKYLLDEMLDQKTAAALSAMVDNDEFRYILDFAEQGTEDEDIPAICEREGFGALITANVKDFGAKKVLYQALLDRGIHVVVLRPGKVKPVIPQQVSLISGSYGRVTAILSEAKGPTLIRVTPGGSAEARTLDELIEEFEAGTRQLP